MENQTFIYWLRFEVFKVYGGLGLGVVVSWLGTVSLVFYNKLSYPLTGENLEKILKTPEVTSGRGYLIAFQAVACIVLAFATPRPKEIATDVEDYYTTVKATQRIHTMVLLLYLSLGLLYLVMACFTFSESPEQVKKLSDPADTWRILFEILTATLIFFLFIELSTITVEPQKDLRIIDYRVYDAFRHRIMFVGVAIFLAAINILWYFNPAIGDQKLIRVVVACLSGITLAMVVGRLGSLYLNPGTTTIFFLYLYAIIQSFASFFPEINIIFIITSLALPLKVLLWLVFVWAFTTGKIGEYVHEVRDIIEKQEPQSNIDKKDNTAT